MKTAKINNIHQKPNFKTNDGKTLYVFELTLDNGDVGAIFKQKENPYVQIGDSINYELTERGTIKIQREGGFTSNNNQYSKDDIQNNIRYAQSLNIANLQFCHGKITESEIDEVASRFYEKLKTNGKGVESLPFVNNKAPF